MGIKNKKVRNRNSLRKRKGFENLAPSVQERFPKKELNRHILAYHYWHGLPETEKTYARVAKEFGVTEGTIAIWSQAFNWIERGDEASRMISDEVIASKKDVIKRIREKTIDLVEEVIELKTFEDGADLKNYIDAAQRVIGIGTQMGQGNGQKKEEGPKTPPFRRAVLLIEK